MQLLPQTRAFTDPLHTLAASEMRDISHSGPVGFVISKRNASLTLVLAALAAFSACGLLTGQFANASHGLPYPSPASHTVYHWDVREYTTTYGGGGNQYLAWTERAKYRWTVDTAHSTRLSINYYRDYGLYEAVDIVAHDKNWHQFSYSDNWFIGNAMVLRGRTLYPTVLYNRNGTLYI